MTHTVQSLAGASPRWVRGRHLSKRCSAGTISLSNRWLLELMRVPAEDAAWLWQDSVYVYVEQPLWLHAD